MLTIATGDDLLITECYPVNYSIPERLLPRSTEHDSHRPILLMLLSNQYEGIYLAYMPAHKKMLVNAHYCGL